MKQPNENLTAQFEKNAQPTPPAKPRDFEKLASNAKALPQVGYAREFQNAEQRGRDILFPPARQMLEGNK